MELRLVRTENADLVKRILTAPGLWDKITEDNSPAPEDFEPVIADSVYYLLAVRDKTIVGLFAVHPMTETTYIIHVNILPKFWGNRKENAQFGKMAVEWVWNNTEAHKLIATVPVIYPHVLGYAQRCGFKREGMLRASYLKGGELHDQYVLGVNR